MKSKHGILACILALTLLGGNALLLPKLLTLAQALPDGEVVTQSRAADAERAPLPEPPEGFGMPYELAFSRPLDAVDGTLNYASRSQASHQSPPDKTAAQVEAELQDRAIDTVMTLFTEGRQPEKAAISGYSFWNRKDSYDIDADMKYLISYVVSMPDGVDYQLDFTTGDGALVSYRYWPDGCEVMG